MEDGAGPVVLGRLRREYGPVDVAVSDRNSALLHRRGDSSRPRLPSRRLAAAAALALHVLVRNRVAGYAVAIGLGSTLLYFYMQGYNDPAYNPLLFNLWTYQDLIGGPNRTQILSHRAYLLAVTGFLIAGAHLVNAWLANRSRS